MRLSNLLSYFLLTLILFISISGTAQTNSFIVSAKHDKIGIDDSAEVTYTLKGNTAYLPKIDSGDFTIAKGPSQTKSENMTLVSSGKYETTVTFVWTYILKPKHMGKLVTPQANVALKDGTGVTSNQVTIEVVAGSMRKKNELADRNMADNNYMLMLAAVRNTHDPFVVSAGPVYQDTAGIGKDADTFQRSAVMNNMFLFLQSKSPYNDLGIYSWENFPKEYRGLLGNGQDDRSWDVIPRRYFTVKDTTGIKTILAQTYPLDKSRKYITIVSDAGKWAPYMDLNFLRSANRLYYDIAYIIKAIAERKIDDREPKDVLITFGFDAEAARANFAKAAQEESYATSDSSDKRKPDQYHPPRYFLKVSKKIKPDKISLQLMAKELLDNACDNKGLYGAVSVAIK